nr:MAG TPA: hypothetical protein [Herelleviridae sp.]
MASLERRWITAAVPPQAHQPQTHTQKEQP